MADTSTQTLLQWLLDLLDDPQARAELLNNSDYLDLCGWSNVDAGDIEDALRLIHEDDDNRDDDDDDDHHHPAPHHHHDHEDASTYLRNYVSNNYTYVDDRDTNIDDSIHQRIDTDGGDFDQTIDNDPVIASGDGAVAAGDDIRDSTVTTGNKNVVGDNNEAVTGDDNTTAFGRGDATNADFEDARFGDGSAVSLDGNARGSAEDNDTSTSVRGGDGDTAVNTADDGSRAFQDADQSDTDTDTDIHRESSVDSHNETNSHNTEDSSHSDNVHLDV